MQDLKELFRDERAIEGLPIRLVIALVVGVACLAIMTSILGGLPTFETTEVTTEYDTSVVKDATGGTTDVTITVVTDEGEPVSGAQVLVSSGTATVKDTPKVFTADGGGNNNEVTITVWEEDHSPSSPSNEVETDFRSDQNKGTIQIEVQPPTDSNFEDEQDNPEIIVTR